MRLKAYLTNKYALTNSEKTADTYILPLTTDILEQGLAAHEAGKEITVAIGYKKVTVKLNNITHNTEYENETASVDIVLK